MGPESILLVGVLLGMSRAAAYLQEAGFDTATATDFVSAERQLLGTLTDAVVLEMGGEESLELVARLRGADPFLPIVLLTEGSQLETAARALQMGADQVLWRGTAPQILLAVLRRHLDNSRARRRQMAEESNERRDYFDPLVGIGEAIVKLRASAEQASASDLPVLIRGEAGTGKRDLARRLHANSLRSEQPFVSLDCRDASRSSPTEVGAESASSEWAAKFARSLKLARRGSLFLNAVHELGAEERFLLSQPPDSELTQDFPSLVVGLKKIRLIAASDQEGMRLADHPWLSSPLGEVADPVVLDLPSLRDRMEDLPLLCADILNRLTGEFVSEPFLMSVDAMTLLARHSWPGNLQELRNALERATMMAGSHLLSAKDFSSIAGVREEMNRREVRPLQEIEKEYIQQALATEGGRVVSTAKKLGIPRSSLYHKLKQYHIDRAAFRGSTSRLDTAPH